MKLLENKVALITGSSRGIGRACAKTLAEHGAKVVVNYRLRKKNAESLVKEIQDTGGEAIAIQADVSLKKDAESLIQNTLNAYSDIDILVNNAGIWIETPADKINEEMTELTLDVNLKSVIYMSNLVIPILKDKRGGKIINISSTAGQRGEAFHSVYAATKGGIISYTRSLSTELAPYHILVNAVAPGWVYTELNESVMADKARLEAIERSIPLGRMSSPEDVAYAVLFLASDWTKMITGQVINVNGGSVMQ